MAGEETTLLKMSEEAYDDSIMSKAIDYSESANFECEISKFRQKYRCLFEDHISNLRNGSDDEQSHEIYQAFLEYQDMIETLFDDFIVHNNISKEKFFASFRAVADGQYTPIFGVHHQQWFLDMLTSWMEYEEFIRLMCKDVLRTSNHK